MIVFGLVLLLAVSQSPGQNPCGPLDLPTAISLAGARSDEVAIKQSEVAAADTDRALARAAYILPQASAQLVFGPSPGAKGDAAAPVPGGGFVTTYTSGSNRGLTDVGAFGRIDIQGVQPLWTWGALQAGTKAAEAGYRAHEYDLADTLSQVQLRVIQLYWGDALARRFLAIAADVEKALTDVDARIDKAIKNESGDVSPSDRFQVTLFRSDLKAREADAQRGQDQARIGLAATLGLDRNQLVLKEVDFEAADRPVPSSEEGLALALSNRPDLLALSQAIVAKQSEVRAKEAALLPTVFIAGEFSYGYAPNRTIISNPWLSDPFNTLTVGAVLGVREDLAIALNLAYADKARAQLKQIERQRSGLTRLIQTQVDSAVADVRAATTRAQATREGLAAGRSWFRSATLDFSAGVLDAHDLLAAYRGYVESQVAQAQSVYDLLVARARYEQIAALPLGGGETHCFLP
jgi:outer membrane protein, multidrug efflux system